jgi:hypothetical protein
MRLHRTSQPRLNPYPEWLLCHLSRGLLPKVAVLGELKMDPWHVGVHSAGWL